MIFHLFFCAKQPEFLEITDTIYTTVHVLRGLSQSHTDFRWIRFDERIGVHAKTCRSTLFAADSNCNSVRTWRRHERVGANFSEAPE